MMTMINALGLPDPVEAQTHFHPASAIRAGLRSRARLCAAAAAQLMKSLPR